MTTTRLLITSFILLCLIAFGRSVHAQEGKVAKQDMQALSRLAPNIQEHLDQAKKIQASLKSKSK